MKTVIAVMLLMGLFGCESEADHQHHLYNIQQCGAETRLALKGTNWSDPNMKGVDPQSVFHSNMVNCMANAEHTTEQFQYDKGDNYGTYTPE